ncbi:MAG: bifunctional adenosylcobinamide kinase/adenosylcobinamide-phosphate guanylyltransferase [Candidatus Brocadiia bacterium]
MKKFILITGGARSGKSHYAVELAKKLTAPPSTHRVVYIATSCFHDEEMDKRIAAHKKSRPAEWQTVEEDKNIDTVIFNLKGLSEIVVIDCLTILTSNLMLELKDQEQVLKRAESMLRVINDSDMTVIAVTNEVGSGIVPETVLGRDFRDLSGKFNQMAAAAADEVYLMVTGIPLKIKGNH